MYLGKKDDKKNYLTNDGPREYQAEKTLYWINLVGTRVLMDRHEK